MGNVEQAFSHHGRAEIDSFVYDEADSIRLQNAINQRPVTVRRAARATNARAAFSPERCTGRPVVGDIHVGPGITYGHGWWTGKVIRRSPQKKHQPAAASPIDPRTGRPRILTSPRRGMSPGRMKLNPTGVSGGVDSLMESMSSLTGSSEITSAGEIEATVGIRNSPTPHFWKVDAPKERQSANELAAARARHGAGLPTRDVNPPKPSPPSESELSDPAGPRAATPGATYVMVGQDVVPAALVKMKEGNELMKGEEKTEKDDEGNVSSSLSCRSFAYPTVATLLFSWSFVRLRQRYVCRWWARWW